MASFLRSARSKSSVLLIVVLLFTFTVCASNSYSKDSTNNSNISKNNNSIVSSNSPITIIIGGKQDAASQLLIRMYALLLRQAGFIVVERANSSTDDAVFNAINGGQIDLSPAFTATVLKKLSLNSTGNAQLDYLQIKQSYEAKYHVTWLDPAPLNSNIYNSAPVVRDSILKKSPQIALALNKLAPLLTAQASQRLQSEVVKNGKSVTVVATQFLQSKGLL